MPNTKYSGVAIPKGGQTNTGGGTFGLQIRTWYGDVTQGERIIDVSSEEPRSWVVTLVPSAPSFGWGASSGGVGLQDRPPDAQRAYARITWGMAGGQTGIVAEIDIGHGVTVPVYGTHVTVDVFVPSSATESYFSSAQRLRTGSIVGSCAPTNGAVSSQQQLTRELYLGNLAPAGVHVLSPIPRFAKSFVVLFGGEYGGALVADVTEANGGGATNLFDRWYMSAGALTVTNQPRWVPRLLPPDGGAIRLSSLESTATLTDVRVVFFLAL